MGSDLDKFDAGSLDIGVHVRSPALSGSLHLKTTALNMSTGLRRGIGPRAGMAPLPYHCHKETLASTAVAGLMCAEQASPGADSLKNRTKLYAILPISLRDFTSLETIKQGYIFVVGHTGESNDDTFIEPILLSSLQSAATDPLGGGTRRWPYVQKLTGGLHKGMAEIVAKATVMGEYLVESDTTFQEAFFRLNPLPQWASCALLTVSGQNNPMHWLYGSTTTDGDVNNAPDVSFNTGINSCPSEYQLQNYTTPNRTIKVYALTSGHQFNIAYSLTLTPSDTTMLRQLNDATVSGGGGATLILSATAATKETAGTTYASSDNALVYDPQCSQLSAYKAVLIADGSNRARACIIQEWNRNSWGLPYRYIDLTSQALEPPTSTSDTSSYQEDGTFKPTCWRQWPSFIRGTEFYTGGAGGWQLGAAGSGVLRSDTVYEVAYSLFNKRLNYESNVGAPAKLQTGVDDFVAIGIFDPAFASGVATDTARYALTSGATYGSLPYIFGSIVSVAEYAINDFEYRFYYREEGTFEWLPAGRMDAAKYWYHPYHGDYLYICTGDDASLPGGQPGGFNDYSKLPKSNWFQVVQYRNRSFWVSNSSINYSMRNNVFAYPARNTIPAITGKFRGVLVHQQPGETEQTSRMIIFGEAQSFVARFTGRFQRASVRVSYDSVGEFDIEGSDLVVDDLSGSTAFSWRAACVAEEAAYWWGPQGVYYDDGISPPENISRDKLEPELHKLYDPNKTDEIHCVYSKQTGEIIWFYPDMDGSTTTTKALCLDVNSGEFNFREYPGKVDASQNLMIDKDETYKRLGGERVVMISRENTSATIQRPYFHDHFCRSGDMAPDSDFVVKSWTTPQSGRRTLTLATGYDATNFATIVAGDYITLHQVRAYSQLSDDYEDCICEVVSTGAGTITVTIPTGADIAETATLGQDAYVPIYHFKSNAKGLNGIQWSMPTRYWSPGGLNYNGYWLKLYWYADLTRLKSVDGQGVTIEYRTPAAATGTQSDTVAIVDNSDGAWQGYLPLKAGDGHAQGQAIRFTFSGYHGGSEWVLQYLQVHGREESGDVLQQFETEAP